MKQHARMLRTLGCLAGAMTSTAVFLHWLDPSLASPAQALPVSEITALARSVVADSVEIRQDQWQDVAVIPASEKEGDGVPLAASPDSVTCHFYVDHSGRPSRARGWTRQTPPDDAPHTIRIQIARIRGAIEFPTDQQWLAIRGLVSALDAVLAQKGRLPIVVQSGSSEAGDSIFVAADLRATHP